MSISKFLDAFLSKKQTKHSFQPVENRLIRKAINKLKHAQRNAQVLADFKGLGLNYHVFMKDLVENPNEDINNIIAHLRNNSEHRHQLVPVLKTYLSVANAQKA